MDNPHHPLAELFKQLGLPADKAAIEAFCAEHAPLNPAIALADAPFWSPTQASFLRESVQNDADWAHIVDELNAYLRKPRGR